MRQLEQLANRTISITRFQGNSRVDHQKPRNGTENTTCTFKSYGAITKYRLHQVSQYLASRQQRVVQLEARILGGSTEQDEGAILHEREKDVLLELVETVNFYKKISSHMNFNKHENTHQAAMKLEKDKNENAEEQLTTTRRRPGRRRGTGHETFQIVSGRC